MRGLVFGLTFSRASKQLDKIVQKYQFFGYKITQQIKNKHQYQVVFDNGDIWKATNASESCRGSKANVAYIDRKLNQEVISVRVMSSLIGPWTATHYY